MQKNGTGEIPLGIIVIASAVLALCLAAANISPQTEQGPSMTFQEFARAEAALPAVVR